MLTTDDAMCSSVRHADANTKVDVTSIRRTRLPQETWENTQNVAGAKTLGRRLLSVTAWLTLGPR
jgi:hypothetical protein